MFTKTKVENIGNTVGSQTAIKGFIEVNGPIDIYGIIIAKDQEALCSKDIVNVKSGGRVEGNISCIELNLEGEILGDVKAEHKVNLLEGCVLEGNIYTKALSIEGGARFVGNVVVSTEEDYVSTNEVVEIKE